MKLNPQKKSLYILLAKLFVILFIFQSLYFFSQAKDNYKIYYEFKFKRSTNNPNIDKEVLVLDYNTQTKESIFYNQNYVYNDSINQKLSSLMAHTSIDMNTNVFKKMYLSDIIYHEKKSKPNEFSIYSILDGDFFEYSTEAVMLWKIDSSTYQIGSYKCRKASTNFGGREWIAYFTDEIPFNIGPYKFHDLPGLIVKISDSENNFEFNIAGIKRIEGFNPLNLSKYIKISEKSYIKAVHNYLLDPSKKLRDGIMIAPDGTKFVITGKNSFTKNDFDQNNSEVYKDLFLNGNCIEITSQKCILEKETITKIYK